MPADTTTESLPEFRRPVEILLVDDDAAWTRGTAGLLEHAAEAFRVETATSLDAGHELYLDCEFDCVVCDYQLGDGTGLDLLEVVREREPDRPFILVTGRGDEELASKAIRQGVTDYVIKDLGDGTELLSSCIASAIEAYRTERALERERQSKTQLLNLLTAATDETALCRECCSLLVETHAYACAWIGTRNESGVVARAAAGDEAYVDRVLYDLPDEDSSEPALEAFDADDPVVRQISAEETAPWQPLAREYGFESAAGVPIDYDGVRLGVLGVYATERQIIDAERIESLSELAETIGYALQTATVKRSLGSDRSVSVEVEVADTAAVLVALDNSLPADSRLFIPSVVFREETTLYLVQIDGAADTAITTAVEATDALSFAPESTPRATGETVQCGIVADEPTPESLLADHGTSLGQTVVEDGTATITGRLSDHREISTVANELQAVYDSAIIASVRQDPETASLGTIDTMLEPLTDKQQTAIEHAYYEGFFEHPRDKTATELAAQFDISRQTLTHHLRAAERKLLDQIFDP